MADKYWVGGGTNTNWNSSPTTNWANSDNGTGNQTAPAAGDRVFFTSNSGTGASVWNTSISLTMLDCTGSKNVVTHNNSVTFTITAGNVILPTGAGGSYTAGGTAATFTFTNTTGTCQFNTNGFTITGFTRSGVGGTTQLTGDCNAAFNTTSTGLSLTGGTLDLNGYTITAPIFSITGAGTRAITGAGGITINNTNASAATPLNITGSGFTLPSFTATTTLSGQHDGVHTFTFFGLTWGPLVVNANGSFPAGLGKGTKNTGSATSTFASVTVNGPVSLIWAASATNTVTGAFNTIGSPGNIAYIAAGAVSQQAIAVGAASTLNWCALRGIVFSGAGSITAKNSLDFGNNGGITSISPPSGVAPNRCGV